MRARVEKRPSVDRPSLQPRKKGSGMHRSWGIIAVAASGLLLGVAGSTPAQADHHCRDRYRSDYGYQSYQPAYGYRGYQPAYGYQGYQPEYVDRGYQYGGRDRH